MTALSFVVPGHPKTWQRPPQAGRGRYDERGLAAKAYASKVTDYARRAVGLRRRAGLAWPLDAEYGVRVVGVWPDAREGDYDRLVSLVYDALQGVCYVADRQVKIDDGGGIASPEKAAPRLIVTVRLVELGERERLAGG
jgi:hypothetical protein